MNSFVNNPNTSSPMYSLNNNTSRESVNSENRNDVASPNNEAYFKYQQTVQENQKLINNFIYGTSPTSTNTNTTTTNKEVHSNNNMDDMIFNNSQQSQNSQDSSFAILSNSSAILDSSMITPANHSMDSITSPTLQHQLLNISSSSSSSTFKDHPPSNAAPNQLLINAVKNNVNINNNKLSPFSPEDLASNSSQSSIMSNSQSSIHPSPVVSATNPSSPLTSLQRLPNLNGSNTSLDTINSINSYNSPSLLPTNINNNNNTSATNSPTTQPLSGQTFSPQISPILSPMGIATQPQTVSAQTSPNTSQILSMPTDSVQGNDPDVITNQTSFVVVSSELHPNLPAISTPSQSQTQTQSPSQSQSQTQFQNHSTPNTTDLDSTLKSPSLLSVDHGLTSPQRQPSPANEPSTKPTSAMNALSNLSVIYNGTLDSIDYNNPSYSVSYMDNSQAPLSSSYFVDESQISTNLTSPPTQPEDPTNKLMMDIPVNQRRLSTNPFINEMMLNHGHTTTNMSNPENDTNDDNPFNI